MYYISGTVAHLLPILGGVRPGWGARVLHPVHGVHAYQGQGRVAHLAGGLLDAGQLH